MGGCSSAPHGQAAVGPRPQRCILALNRPTPVRSRFSVAQSLRGRSAPGGRLVFGVTESWGGGGSGSLLPAGSPCLKRVEIGATKGC